MGSADTRLGPGWLSVLKQADPSLVLVKGADHFMSGEYEFDLLDLVLTALRTP
jgi:hypothetical protein